MVEFTSTTDWHSNEDRRLQRLNNGSEFVLFMLYPPVNIWHVLIVFTPLLMLPKWALIGSWEDVTNSKGHSANLLHFIGCSSLYGAPVLAADLGAGAALVLAGMAAEGTAHIEGVSHVDRGYEKLDHPLHLLGASIQRLPCLPFDSTMQYFHLERELWFVAGSFPPW
jgi:hypothetical protein